MDCSRSGCYEVCLQVRFPLLSYLKRRIGDNNKEASYLFQWILLALHLD